MLPIVWQPHFYMLRNHVRIYLEAAATFSYNISSTYENEQARANGSAGWKGDYPFKLARDNRWGYGLASATATNTTTTTATARKIPSGPLRCVRRSTTL